MYLTVVFLLHVQTQWNNLLWRTSQFEDDPLFMHLSGPSDPKARRRDSNTDAEAILKQLSFSAEGTDFGGQSDVGKAEEVASSTSNDFSKEVATQAVPGIGNGDGTVAKESCDPVAMEIISQDSPAGCAAAMESLTASAVGAVFVSSVTVETYWHDCIYM